MHSPTVDIFCLLCYTPFLEGKGEVLGYRCFNGCPPVRSGSKTYGSALSRVFYLGVTDAQNRIKSGNVNTRRGHFGR